MTTTIDAEYERLRSFADLYLDALKNRSPQNLPISHRLKVTENCQRLALGTGVWRTFRGLEPGGHYFVDTTAGQVAFWGVIEEIRGPALFGVRLKVAGRLITEIECLLVRGGGVFEPDVLLADGPQFHAVVPEEQRLTRAQLEAMANLYFDSIEQVNGDRLPADEGLVRLVNGVADSNVTGREPGEVLGHQVLGVQTQITEGYYRYIEALRARRFPIVDEARGIVHSHVLFDHPGDIEQPGVGTPFGAPNSMLCFEAFKATTVGLLEVWAIGTALPYGCPSGWN